MDDMDLEIKRIIDENKRRKSEEQFDPVTGEGSVGDRFLLILPDHPVPRQWLPVGMRDEPLVKVLTGKGSLAEASRLNPRLLTPRTLAEALARLRCRYDFPFWAATLAKIKNKEGGPDILFRLNPPQKRLVALFEELRLAGEGIRVVMLKARQWGGSTCTQLYMAWLQLIHSKGLNSLIIAQQKSASESIKDMFDLMMKSYPADYLCDAGESITGKERKMMAVGTSGSVFRIPRRSCKIYIGSAERPESARSGDYALVHLSEVALWPDTPSKKPEELVRACLGGQKGGALSMTVLESTAKGSGDFFNGEYEAAAAGTSAYSPIFVPWYEIPRYRIPVRDPEILAKELYANRTQAYVGDDRHEPGTYLWKLWENGATLEGIAWYIRERSKYADHAGMASEYPSNDCEAFANSGNPVFDEDRVSEIAKGCRPPIECGELTAESAFGPGGLRGIRFAARKNGPLKIWSHPETGGWSDRYLCVVDIGGRSDNSDWTVAAVFDRVNEGKGGGPAIVAQWRGHAEFDRLPWICAALAKYYGDALLAIECNTITNHESRIGISGSSDTFFSLLEEHYPNLYMRAGDPESTHGSSPRYGFHTNRRTKRNVIQHLVGVVREQGYVERDKRCISELLSYEEKPDGSYGAIEGRHDDILMTRAIGLYISDFEMDAPRMRIAHPLRRANHPRPDIAF